MLPDLAILHTTCLTLTAVSVVVTGAVVFARHATAPAARLHFAYSLVAAWWITCFAVIANTDPGPVSHLWSRLLLVGVGVLPALAFHLNASFVGPIAGTTADRVRLHWVGAFALASYALLWPDLLGPPRARGWGWYPTLTPWGVVVPAALLFTFVEIQLGYRRALARLTPGTVARLKIRALYRGNFVTFLALVDFLPAFGVGVYPFGWLILGGMHMATLYGSLRYRLIDITPELAAGHALAEMPDGVLVVDPTGVVRLANRRAAELLRGTGDSLEGRLVTTLPLAEVLKGSPETLEPSRRRHTAVLAGDDGHDRHLTCTPSQVRDPTGAPVATLWLLRDVTDEVAASADRDRLEEGVRHAQKLESLGVMASGIAHDFNNLLLAILGNAELAKADLATDHPAHPLLDQIGIAAERASELTAQMLTYTGRRPRRDQRIDLNAVVGEITELLRAGLSKKVEVVLDLKDDLPAVDGDPSQMSQVVLNLITNAAEATQNHAGTVTISTRFGPPGAGFEPWDDRAAIDETRDHVLLVVHDEGAGMPPETVDRIFDPFFTTKFTGRGLGLATVSGIVRSHGGFMRVDTAPGRGTTFSIAFPPTSSPVPGQTSPTPVEDGWTTEGVVLLADDEDAVRAVTREMLERRGFRVVEALDGGQAIECFEAAPEEFAVVVLDRAMPVADGWEAFTRIRALRPDVPVVLMSGYAQATGGIEDERATFVQKPFTAAELASRIRDVTGG